MSTEPLAYFITFRTYGTWLHGDIRGSVDRNTNGFGQELLPAQPRREQWERGRLKSAPVVFSLEQRRVVAQAIDETCRIRGRRLSALNVRTNHAHVVVSAPQPVESIRTALKANATRALREGALANTAQSVWARHGSTRYLWDEQSVAAACDYVTNGQDVPDGCA